MDCNQEYVMFVAEKDKSEQINYTVLDLINFQTKKDKSVMKEYNTVEPHNINYLMMKEKNIEAKSSFITFLKIKELILKCYPQFGLAIKKGLSLKKIMLKFDSNNVPASEDMKGNILGKSFINNLSQNLSKPEKAGKGTSKKRGLSLNSVKEKAEDETRKNTIKMDESNMY
jgi:hypothetical protein